MALFWSLAAIVLAADRYTKHLAQASLTLGERIEVWPGLLSLQLSRNTGVALGILSNKPLLMVVLPLLAMVLGYLVLRRYRATRYTRVAVALVTGGFLGNFIDRIAVGYVPDMVFFPWMPWYICNVADVAITVGIALLAISLMFRPKDWILKPEVAPHGNDHADRRV